MTPHPAPLYKRCFQSHPAGQVCHPTAVQHATGQSLFQLLLSSPCLAVSPDATEPELFLLSFSALNCRRIGLVQPALTSSTSAATVWTLEASET